MRNRGGDTEVLCRYSRTHERQMIGDRLAA
jgi:hypothetical protein